MIRLFPLMRSRRRAFPVIGRMPFLGCSAESDDRKTGDETENDYESDDEASMIGVVSKMIIDRMVPIKW